MFETINPVHWLIAFLLVYGALWATLLWWIDRRQPWYDPRETYADRIEFGVYRWPEWLQPWGHALVKIMRTVRLMARVWKTEAEFDEMAGRFGGVLAHATGGRMSKTNYDYDTMRLQMDEFVERERDEHVVDLIANLPDYENMNHLPTLCEYMSVSYDDVKHSKRRIKQIRAMVERDARAKRKVKP